MKKRLCINDTDFQRSMTFQREVEVWIFGEIDTIGKIGSFNKGSVKINDNYFFRENCEFYII